MTETYDVRFQQITASKGKRGTTHRVRWRVEGRERNRTFETRALADSYRAQLVSAARRGDPFDTDSGLPSSMRPKQVGPTWLEHAMATIDMKWPDSSPSHRKSTAEAFVTVTCALMRDGETYRQADVLRSALRHWSFNSAARRRSSAPPAEYAQALSWAERRSRPLTDLADPSTIRDVLAACGQRLDGRPASHSVATRKRAALSLALVYAVELGHLDSNPLKRVTVRRRPPSEAVDSRTVISPSTARDLLACIAEDRPELHALFACLYYAALRPSEARNVRRSNLILPSDGGWGEIILTSSYRTTGAQWTDSGNASEERELKHRARGDTRRVPATPQLVQALRAHLDTFECGAENRLFVTRAGRAGVPIAPPYVSPIPLATVSRTLQIARSKTLTHDQLALGVARRPYDLRHACVSTWLAAGVPPTQVAQWAGHSVAVLLRVYAHAVEGQEDESRRKIAAALASQAAPEIRLGLP